MAIEKFILNWKGKVKECFAKNYPWNCCKGTFEPKSSVKGDRTDGFNPLKKRVQTITWCKYVGYCQRHYQKAYCERNAIFKVDSTPKNVT